MRSRGIRGAVIAVWVLLTTAAPLFAADTLDGPVTTVHTMKLDGREVVYKATVGRLSVLDASHTPVASMFYVAYVVPPPAGGKPRPLTFLYNGGPGSSSIWLHLGAVGPYGIEFEHARDNGPDAPRESTVLSPNPHSLLDKSDLVFLDAIGTGYSRPISPKTDKDFWAVDADADAFVAAINRYVRDNGRWDSPKFLFGESYGTARSAAVAYKLQTLGMDISGIVLLSSVLTGEDGLLPSDEDYADWLPTYAATAWYYQLTDHAGDLESLVREAREFANGAYSSALRQGTGLPLQQLKEVAAQMHRYTGLRADLLERLRLRVTRARFRMELLADRSLSLSAHDTRVSSTDRPEGIRPNIDAMDAAVRGLFESTRGEYMGGELRYSPNLDYRLQHTPGIPWDGSHNAPYVGERLVTTDVLPDLAASLRENSHLQILSLSGYFDLATPFARTDDALRHLDASPQALRRVHQAYFLAGHMIYLDPQARVALKKSLDAFYDNVVR